MTTVSICIPTYHANGKGAKVLKRLLKSIREQTFTDYEVIVSDHSTIHQQDIYDLCVDEGKDLNLVYTDCHVGRGNSAVNTNNAIDHAQGDLIKVMNHDDFFYHPDALKIMVDKIGDEGWLACACLHTDEGETKLERLHEAVWPGEKNMVEAVNRIGCPTVSLFREDRSVEFKDKLRFDTHEDINYAMDCDFYIQLFRKYGNPVISADPAVVIRIWGSQLSNQVNVPAEIEKGKAYMRRKYGYS
jgi:glycosyltransferase involved in cell wall biosynthesis